jgi:hypothetical protein
MFFTGSAVSTLAATWMKDAIEGADGRKWTHLESRALQGTVAWWIAAACRPPGSRSTWHDSALPTGNHNHDPVMFNQDHTDISLATQR